MKLTIGSTARLLLTVLAGACGGASLNESDAAPGVDARAPGGGDPTPTALSPTSGPLAGGNRVTIAGTSLTGEAIVIVDGNVVADVSTGADGGLTFDAPPRAVPGPVDVVVFDANGYGSIEGGYRYNALPTITSVDPPGTRTGEPITITGTGFTAGDAGENVVLLGELPCAGATTVSDTSITCTAPAPTAIDLVELTVTNRNGTASTRFLFDNGEGLLVADGRGGVAGSIYAIDPTATSPVAVELTTLPVGLSGLAFTASGALYGLESSDGTASSLYRIDPATFVATLVGPLVTAGAEQESQMPDLTAIGETLYAWSENGDRLTTVDPATGVVTPIPTLSTSSGGSGTVARPDGTILFMPGDTPVFVIDPVAVTITPFATLTGSPGQIMALTYHHGRLYGVAQLDDTSTSLVSIDETTWAVTTVATLPGGIDAIASSTPAPTVLPRIVTDPVRTPPARLRPAAAPTPRSLAISGRSVTTDRALTAPGAIRGTRGRLAGRVLVPVGPATRATSCAGKVVAIAAGSVVTPNQKGRWKLVALDGDRAITLLRDVCRLE